MDAVLKNLVVKYAPELPSVLQDVSFTLKVGERIGLLGRTGSGKSTLAMSILRFVDPFSGCIMVDSVDITSIGIHDLRSRLTFIPQDATFFSGSLWNNLDPFIAETSRKPRNKRTVAPSARTLRNLPHRHPSPSLLSDITPTTPTGSRSRSTQPPQSLRRSPRLSPSQSPPEHSSPSVPPHSPISSSPTMPSMPTSTPANQPFLLQGNTKALIVYARKLSLEDFLLVHAGIQQYIEHKEYHNKPVKARGAAMSVFTAAGSVSYFTAHRASLLAMSDQEFLQALLAHALGSRWQDAVSKKISSLQQDSLLVGTPRHLTEPLIQSTLNNVLSEGFTDYLYEKKQSNAIAYDEWCEAVEAHNEDYRAFRKPQMDKVNNEIRELKHTIQKQTSMIEQHKRGATDSHYSNNHARSKPFSSCSTNSSSSSTTSSSTASSSTSQPTSNSSSSSSQQTYGIPPIASIREDPEQYQLLQDGQACHKC
ncbi:hypothetical protein D9758_003942 [Tetrapyrgos nigripes]|uniref:ABC transporter domain-containing protein n=1 Tax=Tetrapyrgos nigripes TaxID=182062 RepID=A0A8H5GLQ9_9AGAR|nr:hypothetical protein D9758_003942 [Tetrapyrgos nigripes]